MRRSAEREPQHDERDRERRRDEQQRQGEENSDKCAWTWNGTVAIGGQSWKIQGNWSNRAANARTGYANTGCIQTA